MRETRELHDVSVLDRIGKEVEFRFDAWVVRSRAIHSWVLVSWVMASAYGSRRRFAADFVQSASPGLPHLLAGPDERLIQP